MHLVMFFLNEPIYQFVRIFPSDIKCRNKLYTLIFFLRKTNRWSTKARSIVMSQSFSFEDRVKSIKRFFLKTSRRYVSARWDTSTAKNLSRKWTEYRLEQYFGCYFLSMIEPPVGGGGYFGKNMGAGYDTCLKGWVTLPKSL